MNGEPQGAPGETEPPLPPPVQLPRWVPVVIALVLIAIAAGALWTGMRRRDVPFWKLTPAARETRGGASRGPMELEPGSSRAMHGGNDVVAAPGTVDPGQRARVVIQGDSESVVPTVRVEARRGVLVDVRPPDAIVYVNDQLIGEARQFMARDQAWEFAEPSGTYRVVVVAPGYKPLQYEVIARPEARNELAVVRGELELE